MSIEMVEPEAGLIGLENLPIEAFEAQVEHLATWLLQNEHLRLDELRQTFEGFTDRLPRGDQRRLWREAHAVYIALSPK